MRLRTVAVVATLAMMTTLSVPATSTAAPRPAVTDRLEVYEGVIAYDDVAALVDLGIDRHELQVEPTEEPGSVRVEAILSGAQAAALAEQGIALAAATDPTPTSGPSAAGSHTVFRPYSGEGGLAAEMARQVADHPDIAELQVIGQTTNGTDIVAVRVTSDVASVPDGRRPATVYLGAQHAREWITPEMVRRLLDHVLAGAGTDPEITRILDRSELWFVPVANPDGYDFTFEEGNRLWRKNLRDNNGDGVIEPGDGVDLNRNFPTRWGYDDEGSSPDPASETYRGPAPGSEPETQALDRLHARITPEFIVNYHSAAELLLHGIGWQVATPSPDDVLYETMVGDDAEPAIPGYDPDISAELYTTNGDTDSHLQEEYGTLGFTPEMATCESASAVDPDDEWDPADCGSGFEFPDDEELVQAEFEKNIPFALAVAESAPDPDDPVSVVGRTAPDFRVDSFEVSHGDRQPVAVVAKRSLRWMSMRYRIDGGRERVARVSEWDGGERYGDENDDYYAEYRGIVRGAPAGASVEVWFEARSGRGLFGPDRSRKVESEHFTYTVAHDTGNDVLVLANEDYTGVNPVQPDTVTAPEHLDAHVAALAANGVEADTWDVDALGVPHDLGVLSHYDAVVWYFGENRLTQDPEDEITETSFAGPIPDAAVAERQQYLTIAVRDYLNEGGKLIHDGETTGYFGLLGSSLGGIYYGLDGAPEEDCVVSEDPFSDCLLLADDFVQYYLGAYSRTPVGGAAGVIGTVPPVDGESVPFGGPATVENPIDEAGAFTVTSDELDPEQFPQFADSAAAAEYVEPTGAFIPVEGRQAIAAEHGNDSWMRLSRTFDLTEVAADEVPTFEAQLSYETELGYDHVIVEARTAGGDDWTTLPDVGGLSTTEVPIECEAGFFLETHPALSRYVAAGNPCQPSGTSGSWNSFTGSSDGWQPVSFDLSAFAGNEVEVVISYVSDPFTGGTGLIVDDTRLVTTAGAVEGSAEGFEDGLGAWTVPGPPEGSPGNDGDFALTIGLGGITSAVTTDDTVLLGFGLEQLATDEARAGVVGAALDHLGCEVSRRGPSRFRFFDGHLGWGHGRGLCDDRPGRRR